MPAEGRPWPSDDDDDDDGDDGDDKGGGGDDGPSLRTSKLAKPTDRTPSGTILRHGQEIKNKSSSSSLEHIVWHCKQVFFTKLQKMRTLSYS